MLGSAVAPAPSVRQAEAEGSTPRSRGLLAEGEQDMSPSINQQLAQAVAKNKKIAQLLCTGCSKEPRDLADTLPSCSQGAYITGTHIEQTEPCRSPLCSVCQLVRQRRLYARLRSVAGWLTQYRPELRATAVTITLTTRYGCLFRQDICAFRRQLRKLFHAIHAHGYRRKIE